MATPVDPAYRAQLQALGERYAASLPERMGAIAQALAKAGANPDREALEGVHHGLHVVAGSAGSFGFTVLGTEARRLEQIVRGLLAGQSGWTALVPQIEAYLAWAAIDPKSTTYRPHD